MAIVELEKTYLAKSLPNGMLDSKSKEIIDLYLPLNSDHPKLRLRKNGDKYELTKKTPANEGDASNQIEQTIVLSEEEFNTLLTLPGKKVHKIRYEITHGNRTAEIDVFQGDLKGLVLVDFEFDTEEKLNSFQMPEFCLADVTQEMFIAGGKLCSRAYNDIQADLNRFNYSPL